MTEAGLERLTALPSLRELNLINTKLTAADVAKLQRALPRCAIVRD